MASPLPVSSPTVRLANQPLWNQFNEFTTEMVVTKNGRKMFPKLEYVVSGLDPDQHYGLMLQIQRVDDYRYKFCSGEWTPAGRAEPASPSLKSVFHHDGVMPGSGWMRQPVHFERVKITNNTEDRNPSHIILQSMHRYVPVLTILRMAPTLLSPTAAPPQTPEVVAKIRLSSTEFIAVTAYQNQQVTQLKITHNPFAKGFRDGGSSSSSLDRKRSSTSPLACPSPKRSPPMMPFLPSFSPLTLPSPPVYSSVPTSIYPLKMEEQEKEQQQPKLLPLFPQLPLWPMPMLPMFGLPFPFYSHPHVHSP